MKLYVDVLAMFDIQGEITPVKIRMEEGAFKVDKIVDVCNAASLKSGGAGIRYTCYIAGRLSYLFLEETKWFLETVN